MNGQIAEPRIWNVALSADDVAAEFKSQSAAFYSLT